jgi:glycerophosphoryl diester phosphodiesterase
MQIVLAHRGVVKYHKENTLFSLNAIKKYTNTNQIIFGVEFDINLTLDNQIVLYHDKRIKGTDTEITNITYMELKDLDNEITLLEEVIQSFDNTEYILNIELKKYPKNKIQYCDEFIRIISKYTDVNYFTSSFDKFIVDYLRENKIISYQLLEKNSVFTHNDNNNEYIIHYSDIELLPKSNIVGVYTLWDTNFDPKYIDILQNIKYLITDDVNKFT